MYTGTCIILVVGKVHFEVGCFCYKISLIKEALVKKYIQLFSGVKPKINIVDILKPADEVEAQQIEQGICY